MKILFQGDSITDTLRTSLYNPQAQLGCGYPLFVAGTLGARFPGKKFEIINRGISGNRSVDLYQRWKVDGLNLEPDVISILIGVNDTWHEFGSQNGVEIERSEMILNELLKWTKKVRPEVKLILCEPFLFLKSQTAEGFEGGWAPTEEWRPDVDKRIELTRKLAKEYDAVLVPFQDVLNEALKQAPADHWLADGVHPTTAGHALLADAWIRAATPILGI